MTASSRPGDGSADVWIKHYLTSLLNDPVLRTPKNLLQVWLDQQVDPSAPSLRDNHARVTIQHVIDRSPRTVLLGPAGSGKSLLVRQLVRQLAEEALAQPHSPLPLYIPLTFFAGSIEGTLGAQARLRGPSLATLALQRPCVLIVDALNDVAANEQLQVLGMLRRAMQQLGPQGRWLINCRTEQWSLFVPWLQESRSQIWRIRPWNDQTVSTVLRRLQGCGIQRLINYHGCLELARRPRWLGSLTALNEQQVALKPGQIALEWLEHVFAEAARTHCLSNASATAGLTLLKVLAEVLSRQQRKTLSRAAIIAVTDQVADGVGLSGDELLALLDATGVLDSVGDDEWALRSVFLADLAVALNTQHDSMQRWQQFIGQGHALPLLYGLLEEPHRLIQLLLDAQAWEEVQRVLDANENPAETLAMLEETQRVDIDTGAALGRVWAQAGNVDVAVMLLQWAVRQGRDDPQLYSLLGDIYARQGKWNAARNSYTAAIQRDPLNLSYSQALARTCHELGEDEVATMVLEQAMSTHHRQLAETAFNLGGVYEQRGRYADALNQYTSAVAFVPSDSRFGLGQGRALRRLQRYDEARSLLRSIQSTATDPVPLAHEWAALMVAQGNDEQALVHLEHLVELGAATADVYLHIGQIYRRHGDTTASHRAFSTAIDLDPRSVSAYEHLADLAITIGDIQTAAAAYRRLAELLPADAAVHRHLGGLLRQLGQHNDAVQALLTSLQLEQTGEAYLQLARVRWAQGEQARALNNYRSALELSPVDGAVAAETGWALIESGDAVAALEPLHTAASLLPTNRRVLYDLGRAYEMQARRSEALEWYERAVGVAPLWVEALRATGRLAYEAGHIALARTHLARALRVDRHDSEALAAVGRLHLGVRNGLRAYRALRRAITQGSAHPTLYRDLADALLLTGQAVEALQWLERADEDDADVQMLRSKAYEQLGDPRHALLIVRGAAARRSRDHRLQRRLGALALAAGNVSEALVALETATTLGDTDAQTQLNLSRALLLVGKPEAALPPAETAVARAPHLPAAFEQLGRVQLALGQLKPAGDAFERALELDESLPGSWAGLADVWWQRHSIGAALPYARHAQALAPDDDTHRLRLARLLTASEDYAAAQAMLETLKQPQLEAEQLLLEIAVATEQWQVALSAAERVIEITPKDVDVLAIYGRILLELGQPADAIQPLMRACARPNAPAEWWAWQGKAYLAVHQWSAAANALEQSLQRDQQQPALYVELAQAYMQQGQPNTAAQALQTALQYGGEQSEWRAQLAQAYEKQNWLAEAVVEWQRAQVLDPQNALYSRKIGQLHLALGSPHDAVLELEQACALDPQDRSGWELYAEAALAVGDAPRAVHAAASALGLEPSAVEPRQLLGEALLRSGDPARATQCLLPLLETATTPHALLLLHESAEAADNLPVARRALENAYRVAPENVEVQLRLAAHLKPQDSTRALKLLRTLAQRHPERADVAATLAECAFDTGEVTLARTAAEHAVARAPESQQYRKLLGQICLKLGDLGTAHANLQHVFASRPHDSATALALGKIALERQEISEAIRLLQLAAQAAPHDPNVLGTLGIALRYSWQPVWEDELMEPQSGPTLQQAIAALEQAAAGGIEWRAELGWTRLIAGDVAGAVSDLAESVRQLPAGSPHRALPMRRLALALVHARQWNDARSVISNAATLAPHDPLVASIQGQIAQHNADWHEAVQFYARAVALDRAGGRHHLRLGGALLESRELEVALDHLERGTELEPARVAGWILLSRALLELRQNQRAFVAAKRATHLGHDDAAAWRQLAAVAESLGNIEVALDAFERATTLNNVKEWLVAYAELALAHGREERGRAALRRAAYLDHDDSRLAYRLAAATEGQERIAQLERAIQLDPANARWRMELAQTLATKGQYSAAITHLTQAVDAEPREAHHWVALSEALVRSGDSIAAEANLRRGLEFQPDSAALWLNLGSLLASNKQWLDAWKCFVQAAEHEPTAAASAGQGHCLLQLYPEENQLEQARAALQTALELDPNDAEALADLGRVHFLQGRWKEAVRHAGRATKLNPRLVDAYRTIAEAALEMPEKWLNDAHEALEQALAVEPDAPDLHALQGWTYFYESQYAEALVAARTAITGAPDEASYYLLEAYVLRRMRNFKEAIESLRKAVKINRNYSEALKELMTLTSELFIQNDHK